MKIIYAYPLDVPHPAVASLRTDAVMGFSLSIVGVVEATEVEECIAQYAQRADDRNNGYLVVDADEYTAFPRVEAI